MTMGYEEAVEDVQNRTNDRKEPTLENTGKALESLGRPDRDYEVILVGGTNGKGSTSEMISQMLRSQGMKVGKFTSPHLVTLRERIQIDGENISKREFMEIYSRLKDTDLTFFEFMAVAACLYFSERDINYAVMEVGMGGRLDATNATEHSAAVITNVGRDHMKYLGDTREEIAEEKAGIITENGLLIDNSDMEIFREKADQLGARTIETLEIDEKDQSYLYDGQSFDIPLEGSFQKQNLETALTAVSELEGEPDDIGKALENARCPGRMEKIRSDPVTILDGAHNPEAVEKLVESIDGDFVCVFAAMEDKEIEEMITVLEKQASRIIATEPEIDRSRKAEDIARKTSVNSEPIERPLDALREAQEKGDKVLVTGSLYLIGDLKKQLEQRTG